MPERDRYLNDDVVMGTQWEAFRRAIASQDFIESGMEVTAGAGVDMDIDIAAGVFYIAGTRYVYAGGTDTVAANASGNPRWDLVYIDSTGVVQIHAGTPHATNPKLDDLPDGDLYLGSVYVVSGETDIEDTEVYQWEFRSSIFNHSSEHESGGDDELDLEDLTGKLATDQIAIATPSETLRNSNDDERTHTGDTNWTKVKETLVNEGAEEMRIRLDFRMDATARTGLAQLRKNGEVWGTQHAKVGPSYETFTEDLGPVEKGDLIQLYIKSNSAAWTPYVRRLRFYYDTRVTRSVTNQDP